MDRRTVKLDKSWLNVIGGEFDKPYMQGLRDFLLTEKQQGKVIYPDGANIFNALNATAFEDVKVVILGQDPYHGPGQAHGLCFSVPPGVKPPPSLVNIYKELHQEFGMPIPSSGCLQSWAAQGVLLLNATLTVQQASAGSHQGKGWEAFTDAIVHRLNDQAEGVVFLLWGSYAQKKASFVDATKHLVLKSPHPSPLSAHRGFFGNGHFVKTNDYLAQLGKTPIDWSVPA